MILAITERYKKYDDNEYWKEFFYINKYFKDIFEELNVLLFPVASDIQLEKVEEICDGLVVTGRAIDINPKYYGEGAIEQTNLKDYDLEDELDFSLIRLFYKCMFWRKFISRYSKSF